MFKKSIPLVVVLTTFYFWQALSSYGAIRVFQESSGPHSDKVFFNLQDALNAAGAMRPSLINEKIIVELSAGVYRIDKAITIGLNHSGTKIAPLIVRAKRGEKVVLSGASEFQAEHYSGNGFDLSDIKIDQALGQVAVLKLDDLVLSSLNEETPRGSVYPPHSAGPQIYQGHDRLRSARWPNYNFAVASHIESFGEDSRGPKFVIPRDKALSWSKEKDIWIGAFWGHDWHFETARPVLIDPNDQTMTISPLRQPYPMMNNARYYVYNALSELDAPGEYFFDPIGHLIVYRPISSATNPLTIEIARVTNLVSVNNAHDIVFDGIEFEKSQGDAIVVKDSENVSFVNCVISYAGSRGLVVSGGENVVFDLSAISHTGESGAELSGGDRTTLRPSSHRISRSIITHFGEDVRAYRPAVSLEGVGQIIEASLVANGPHTAIWFSGNDHRIESNEIRDVVTETLDAGAIMAGRDWTARGTVIAGNYFHHIKSFDLTRRYDVPTIYLDDFISQTTIENNVFYSVDQGVFINGGRDNVIKNNLFVDVRLAAVRMQSLVGSVYAKEVLDGGTALKRLTAVPYRSKIYAEKYPNLPNIASDDLIAPKYNIIVDNVFSNSLMIEFNKGAQMYATANNNINVNMNDYGSSDIVKKIVRYNSVISGSSIFLGRIEADADRRRLLESRSSKRPN